jgi:hypothetical protein
VDLSGLIFVALAIAWAAYLIPKALRHHEDVTRERSVDRFSQSLRVLARREPVSPRSARLVVPPAGASGSSMMTTGPSAAAADVDEVPALRRLATVRATKRRRRVLSLLVLGLVGAVALGAVGRLGWPYVAIPATMLVAWLVACRLMVRRERASMPAAVDEAAAHEAAGVMESAPTGSIPVTAQPAVDTEAAQGLWDPVPVTLPTYVSKPAARRSVRTIDLDSTGVWTSGRSEADSALAREAEAADRVRRRATRKSVPGDEAVGS